MADRQNQTRTAVPKLVAGSQITESALKAIADALNTRRPVSNPSTQRTR